MQLRFNILLIFVILLFFCQNEIQSQEREIEFENIDIMQKIFPEADKFEESGDSNYFLAYSDENLLGYIFIGNNEGFESKIKTLTGIDVNGICTSLEVVEHSETPPFFEMLIENDFFSVFRNIDINEIDIENKDFSEYPVDVISGATCSSNAIINNFWDAAIYFTTIIK